MLELDDQVSTHLCNIRTNVPAMRGFVSKKVRIGKAAGVGQT